MNRMRYKNYLFDLDGTLIDSAPSVTEAFQRAVSAIFNSRETDRDIIRSWTELPLTATLLHYPEDKRRILEREYIKANSELQKDGVAFFDGMRDVLTALKKSGTRLAIVSNKRKPAIEYWADVMGVSELFDCIIGREDVEKTKPDAEPIILCLKQINGKRDESIYIGDNLNDLNSAKNAGVAFAAVDWTQTDKTLFKKAEPDYWINAPKDLLNL